MMKPIYLLGLNASFAALLIFVAAEAADAQRGSRGGGGGRASGGGQQVRSSASGSIQGASRNSANANRNVNRNVNQNVNRNVNRNVNVNRDIDVDVDHGWGGYHPVARGAAVAATTAVVMGAYYSSLPTGCVKVIRVAVTYYQCGTYWYQPTYSGNNVQYVVVAAP